MFCQVLEIDPEVSRDSWQIFLDSSTTYYYQYPFSVCRSKKTHLQQQQGVREHKMHTLK